MKRTTLARWIVGTVTLLQIIAISLPARDAGPVEGVMASDAGYVAGSHPLGPVVSLSVLALYAWVLSLPADPARRFISAGLGRKSLAVLADFLLAMLLVSPWAGFIAVSIEAVHSGSFVWYVHRDQATSADFSLSFLLTLASLCCLAMYFAWPQHRGRPSPGELLLGIGLKYQGDRPLSLWRAMGRVLLGLLTLVACIVTVPMTLFDPERRMWQDKTFGTRVVQWQD